MILPNALQQQQQQQPSTTSQSQQVPPLAPMGALTPTLGLGMGMSMPHTKYASFALPITSIPSQTPVRNQVCGINLIGLF